MEHIELLVKGLSYSQTQSGAYALVLGEAEGERRLPIIIGGFEAQSIAIALEKEVNPPRPLTHDLFKNFAELFAIKLKQVIIHKLQDGVFYSILICERAGDEQVIDARTSDAVALAIRFKAPIYTYASILDKAGVILGDQETAKAQSDEAAQSPEPPRSLEELHRQLAEAVKNEDYETAARLRDEIDKRES